MPTIIVLNISGNLLSKCTPDRMRQLEMQAAAIEEDLNQAKTLHQGLNQAYKDQSTQDEQESEEDYSEARLRTKAPKQER
ncbi:hypothetical protein BGX21_004132 [Mortierella sp. AD011]|nr:hypothetical protein BGX21_004132 [Mortierella sp. AD011]